MLALQGQLRAMRHELTTSNAYSAAAVAEAGAARAAAAAAAAAAGAAARAASPCMAGSPVSMRCCSPAAAAVMPSRFDAAAYPTASSPAAAGALEAVGSGVGVCGCSGDSAGAAAAAVAAELQALRASRANYQSTVLQQQAVRNSLLGSLGDALEVGRLA